MNRVSQVCCVIGLTIVVAACSTGGTQRAEVNVGAGGIAEFEGVLGAAVVSGTDSSGWLVAQVSSEPAFALVGFSSDDMQIVADLPEWQQGVDAVSFNGGVLAGGVRCQSPKCSRTIADLVTIDPDGTVKDFAVVGDHEGAPDDTDAVTIVGITNDGAWVYDFEGRLTALDDAGSPAAGPIGRVGEPCVIDSDLYALQPDEFAEVETAPIGPAEEILSEGKGFRVERWDGARLSPAEGGRLEADASPGPIGFCAGGGF